MSRTGKSIETGSVLMAFKGWGKGKWRVTANGPGVSSGMFWNEIGVMMYNFVHITKTTGFFFTQHVYFYNDFYFFYYRWFTVFSQFSTVQQSDPVSHTHTHSFSHIILHHVL